MKTRYLGWFVWVLLSGLTWGWIRFNRPSWVDWYPETFFQFVLALFLGIVWFISGVIFEALLGDWK